MGDQNTRTRWRQVNLWCDDWQAAEHMAVTHLGPLLTQAEDTDSLACWWFIRKGSSWRLRFLPTDGPEETATAFLDHLTTTLMDQGAIRRHAEVIYEPEIHAFGGAEAMVLAHNFFHADSRHILHHLALSQPGTDHRREVGLLLGTQLMHAAGQDWYEQGDIWAQFAAHRITETHHEPSPATLAAVQQLLTAAGDTDDSPLASAPDWPAAFEHTGQILADMARQGTLTRGLRAVLAHHLLFTFNRLGVAAQHQHVLATAASQVIFRQDIVYGPTRSSGSGRSHSTTVSAVTTDTTTTTADPEQLREALVSFIDGLGTFRTSQVKDAFRAVPRHVFLPGVDLTTAYAPKPVVTRRAEDGTAVSSASSPNIVATMLEQLDVGPGHRVLEIGAATGINAALLAELVGPTGLVLTIELDDDLAAGARNSLTATGYHQVEVLCGDGALGNPARAPYNRIIVTAGAWDIASAWWHQLAVGGRLVVPLRLHGSGLTRSIAFDLEEPGLMVSTSAAVCGFVPLRCAAEMNEPHVRLADDVILKLDADDLPDQAALAQALTHPADEHWTGVQVRHDEPAAHLDLWLATTTGGASFGRLSVGSAARALGLVNPATRWAGAALYDSRSIAYLAARPTSDEAIELGVIAHGPTSSKLADRTSELLHHWSQQRPAQPIITAHPARTPSDTLPPGAHIGRPDTSLTISW